MRGVLVLDVLYPVSLFPIKKDTFKKCRAVLKITQQVRRTVNLPT